MSTHDCFQKLFSYIEEMENLPGFSIERRLDVFVAHFLPGYLSEKVYKSKEVRLIAAEFPLKKPESNQFTAVDYLCFVEDGNDSRWVLVEFKTSEETLKTDHDQKQFNRYRVAQEAGMVANLTALRQIRAASDNKSSFDSLLQKISGVQAIIDQVDIVYLTPLGRKPAGFSDVPAKQSPHVFWVSMKEFGEYVQDKCGTHGQYLAKYLNHLFGHARHERVARPESSGVRFTCRFKDQSFSSRTRAQLQRSYMTHLNGAHPNLSPAEIARIVTEDLEEWFR